MDIQSRYIIRAMIVIIVMALGAFAVSLYVPYDVTFDAQITDLAGEASIIVTDRAPRPITSRGTDAISLRIGETLKLAPGTTATITFTINGGRATVQGPASFRLVESHRNATTIGHVLGDGDYTLTVEQDGGTARYYFHNADPAIDEMNVTVWINHAINDIVPLTEPCWIANTTDRGPAVSAPILCP